MYLIFFLNGSIWNLETELSGKPNFETDKTEIKLNQKKK